MNLKELIPVKYKVNGIEINTIVRRASESGTQYGSTNFVEGIVYLNKEVGCSKVCESQMRNTAYHEMVHVILDSLGDNELSNDEKFVTRVAGALCEVMDSIVMKSYNDLVNGKENEKVGG